MKKTAMTAAGMLIAISILAGCGGNITEEKDADGIEVQEKTETDEVVEDAEAVTDGIEESIEEAVSEEEITSEKEIEKAQEEMKQAAREILLEEERQMIDTDIPLYGGAHIAIVSKSADGEFWGLVKQGMEDAVAAVNEMYGFSKEEEITMYYEGAESELDVETQVNTIDAVISENPDVLCISAVDMDSCIAQLEMARENGIPVVAFDSNVSESELITAYRASDNQEVGKMAAEKLAAALGETGAVAVFSAPEMTESGKQRMEGFQKELENHPGVEIVEIIYLDQVEDMKSAMQGAIAEHPEMKGVFCTNAEVTEIYLTVEETLEGREILMVGVDATTMQQDAIHSGRQLGVISQNPHLMGFETVWTALLATVQNEEGVEFEKRELLAPAWIDLENIDDPEYGKYLY